MFRRALWLAACVAGLAGCASAPPAPSIADVPWQDQAFNYHPKLVALAKEDLFRLDPGRLKELQGDELQRLPPEQRLQRLLLLLFGPDRTRFKYAPGHSTVAAETWQLLRGDCLSLTVLTYAVARAMNMTPQMQEVDIPTVYDRRGSLDFANQHVNVLFKPSRARLPIAEISADSNTVIVDFEPQFGSNKVGRALSENAILARFYNNLGVEHLAHDRKSQAYAHFKAAMAADPAYAASYTNMAVLYRSESLNGDAEQLLKRAIALSDPPDVALRLMHGLLLDQGRNAEALQAAAQLKALRDRDPYHWIGLGVSHLQHGDNRQAVSALERALKIANGFPEVHRYLAIAYWRSGNQVRANEQLEALAQLDGTDPNVPVLRKKFSTQ